MTAPLPPTPPAADAQRRANLRLALILATVALTFGLGFVIKVVMLSAH